jgi:hypothetical protein
MPVGLVDLFAAQKVADRVISGSTSAPAFDYHLALMSMPRVVGTTVQTVPDQAQYIRPSPDRSKYWEARLKPITGRKIGLAWAGRPEHPNDRRRSIPAHLLQALKTVPDATFFVVQPRSANTALPPDLPLIDLGSELINFSETAALISQLDLLITVDTSVAHLAGAMGKNTWLLLPFSPDWRWLMQSTHTPWYAAMKLFRQRKLGDWAEVVARVVSELKST